MESDQPRCRIDDELQRGITRRDMLTSAGAPTLGASTITVETALAAKCRTSTRVSSSSGWARGSIQGIDY